MVENMHFITKSNTIEYDGDFKIFDEKNYVKNLMITQSCFQTVQHFTKPTLPNRNITEFFNK